MIPAVDIVPGAKCCMFRFPRNMLANSNRFKLFTSLGAVCTHTRTHPRKKLLVLSVDRRPNYTSPRTKLSLFSAYNLFTVYFGLFVKTFHRNALGCAWLCNCVSCTNVINMYNGKNTKLLSGRVRLVTARIASSTHTHTQDILFGNKCHTHIRQQPKMCGV